MPGWSDFAVVTGGAAAALMGLLFVAVTLRIDAISRAPDLRSRAAQTLTLFSVALVTAIVTTVPDQPAWALGVELIALGLVGGATMLTLNARAQRVPDRDPVAQVLQRVGPNATTVGLIACAGVLVTLRVEWGSDLLVPAQVTALIGGVVSAWLFLASIPIAETR